MEISAQAHRRVAAVTVKRQVDFAACGEPESMVRSLPDRGQVNLVLDRPVRGGIPLVQRPAGAGECPEGRSLRRRHRRCHPGGRVLNFPDREAAIASF